MAMAVSMALPVALSIALRIPLSMPVSGRGVTPGWFFALALIVRHPDGYARLRAVPANICGLNRDCINPAAAFTGAFCAQRERVITCNLPVRRSMPAAFGILGFIAAHPDDQPGHRPALVS